MHFCLSMLSPLSLSLFLSLSLSPPVLNYFNLNIETFTESLFVLFKRPIWKRGSKKQIVLLREFRSLNLSYIRRERIAKGIITIRSRFFSSCVSLKCSSFMGDSYPLFSGLLMLLGLLQKLRSSSKHIVVIYEYKTT